MNPTQPDWFPPPSLWREPPPPRVAKVMPHRPECRCPRCVDYPPLTDRRAVHLTPGRTAATRGDEDLMLGVPK